MKRKFLAALLALVMVFSMIPVSASAAGNVIVTGDDPITDNDRSVSFHLYTTQLYKLIMLEDNSATADSDVSGVSLLLYNGFGVLDRTELSLRKIGATKAETDYFEYSDTNRGHALEPNNIEGLKISYSTGDSQKEITIDASNLDCNNGIRRNVLIILGSSKCFFISVWILYPVIFIILSPLVGCGTQIVLWVAFFAVIAD